MAEPLGSSEPGAALDPSGSGGDRTVEARIIVVPPAWSLLAAFAMTAAWAWLLSTIEDLANSAAVYVAMFNLVVLWTSWRNRVELDHNGILVRQTVFPTRTHGWGDIKEVVLGRHSWSQSFVRTTGFPTRAIVGGSGMRSEGGDAVAFAVRMADLHGIPVTDRARDTGVPH